jgi:cephalosporin hydroxylase
MVETLIDVEASLAATGRQHTDGAVKVHEDLDRYRRVIEATRPEVLVECGTWQGGSAVWFADQGLEVVTVDIEDHVLPGNRALGTGRVTWLLGSSADPAIAATVAAAVAGRRTMVVLDSDHSAHHVTREIDLYAPLVTPGCYLVIEDGIVRWMNDGVSVGSPLDSIEQLLAGSKKWIRDTQIEALHPVSMHPAGWLKKKVE